MLQVHKPLLICKKHYGGHWDKGGPFLLKFMLNGCEQHTEWAGGGERNPEIKGTREASEDECFDEEKE